MILIKNGHIKTMAGTEIENGSILLENGKIALSGTGEALMKSEEVKKAYLGG